MIDNIELLDTYVTPRMNEYFKRKLNNCSADKIDTMLCELIKFLILVDKFEGNIIFGKEIDDVWHLWILQTREYSAFCDILPHSKFCHHSSKEYDLISYNGTPREEENRNEDSNDLNQLMNVDKIREDIARVLRFFIEYKRMFGVIAVEAIPYWPPLEKITKRLSWNAEDLNTFLEQQVEQTNQGTSMAAKCIG